MYVCFLKRLQGCPAGLLAWHAGTVPNCLPTQTAARPVVVILLPCCRLPPAARVLCLLALTARCVAGWSAHRPTIDCNTLLPYRSSCARIRGYCHPFGGTTQLAERVWAAATFLLLSMCCSVWDPFRVLVLVQVWQWPDPICCRTLLLTYRPIRGLCLDPCHLPPKGGAGFAELEFVVLCVSMRQGETVPTHHKESPLFVLGTTDCVYGVLVLSVRPAAARLRVCCGNTVFGQQACLLLTAAAASLAADGGWGAACGGSGSVGVAGGGQPPGNAL